MDWGDIGLRRGTETIMKGPQESLHGRLADDAVRFTSKPSACLPRLSYGCLKPGKTSRKGIAMKANKRFEATPENLLRKPSEWTDWDRNGWRFGFIEYDRRRSERGQGSCGISAIEIRRGRRLPTGRYAGGVIYFVVKGEISGYYADNYNDACSGQGSAVPFRLQTGAQLTVHGETFVACTATRHSRLTIIHAGGLQFVDVEIGR